MNGRQKWRPAVLSLEVDSTSVDSRDRSYARAALAYEHVVWRFCQPADPPAARLLEQALLRLPESAAAVRTLLAGALARTHLLFGTVADAKARGEQAIAMARQLGDPGVLATTLNYLIDGAGYPDSPEGSLRYATEALAAADQVDNVEMVHFARSRRLASYIELGDVGRAEAELEALTRLDARIRQRIYLVGTLLHRITFALMRGELAEAERLIVQSMALVRRALRSQRRSPERPDLHAASRTGAPCGIATGAGRLPPPARGCVDLAARPGTALSRNGPARARRAANSSRWRRRISPPFRATDAGRSAWSISARSAQHLAMPTRRRCYTGRCCRMRVTTYSAATWSAAGRRTAISDCCAPPCRAGPMRNATSRRRWR